jgi:GGDEF domain-containing protein
MAMLTLKRYLSGTGEESSYRKVIALLLNGIAEHGVCASAVELETFRDEMRAIREKAGAECSLEELFAAGGATIQALDSYNARTTRRIRRQGSEMQNVISMLAQTVMTIGGGTERSSEALHDIKYELEQTAAIGDIQKLKLRLGECLKKVCDESTRQKTEAAAVTLELQRNMQNAQSCAGAGLDADPVTGLPTATAAKAAFLEGLKSPVRKYILTMVVDRIQPINARFGNAVGDEVLRVMRKHIESNVVAPGDVLFRWTGPTLVALLPRKESIDQMRSGLARLLDRRIEHEFDVGGRSALIPLSVAWSVIGLIPPVANVALFIDKFVAAQTPHETSAAQELAAQ